MNLIICDTTKTFKKYKNSLNILQYTFITGTYKKYKTYILGNNYDNVLYFSNRYESIFESFDEFINILKDTSKKSVNKYVKKITSNFYWTKDNF